MKKSNSKKSEQPKRRLRPIIKKILASVIGGSAILGGVATATSLSSCSNQKEPQTEESTSKTNEDLIPKLTEETIKTVVPCQSPYLDASTYCSHEQQIINECKKMLQEKINQIEDNVFVDFSTPEMRQLIYDLQSLDLGYIKYVLASEAGIDGYEITCIDDLLIRKPPYLKITLDDYGRALVQLTPRHTPAIEGAGLSPYLCEKIEYICYTLPHAHSKLDLQKALDFDMSDHVVEAYHNARNGRCEFKSWLQPTDTTNPNHDIALISARANNLSRFETYTTNDYEQNEIYTTSNSEQDDTYITDNYEQDDNFER